ncbi:MAG: large conductance mechanosensitive channel protein MscL [Armatimonadetes bacterium]|nr:large conductance mechanosensitive channel protein MscL [Armatimonadota bacterium]MBS1704038.1 large conductance mechanosensitive channel protein MscL [Armatimonadota bacterium]
MFKEFRDFINKGNMLDLAIGVVVGAAFTTLTGAFMSSVVNPLVGMISGGADFSNKFIVLKDGPKAPAPYETMKAATDAGANVLAYGSFISAIVNFLVVMLVMFFVVKAYNRMKEFGKKEEAPAEAPAKPEDVALLEEIRDLLRNKAS